LSTVMKLTYENEEERKREKEKYQDLDARQEK
jgi:hypothetical protein